MSITSVIAFGFDPAFCAEDCKTTRISLYLNSGANVPYSQMWIRPSMSITAVSFENAEALIEAYWKNLAMPGQGGRLVIGEPLSTPFRCSPKPN